MQTPLRLCEILGMPQVMISRYNQPFITNLAQSRRAAEITEIKYLRT